MSTLPRLVRHLASLAIVGLLSGSAPAQPRLDANQLPDFIRPGARLTFHEGASNLAGKKFVPDENGPILVRGRRHRMESNAQAGGVGLLQINIVAASPQFIGADAASYLNVDLASNTHTIMQNVGMTGNGNGLGQHWIHPARLAAMEVGLLDENTRVTRDTRQFNGRPVDVIIIQYSSGAHYSSNTYDLASGIRLFGGAIDGDPGISVKDENSVITEYRGNVSYSHSSFVGIRQTQVPWADEPAPAFVQPRQQLNYVGGTRAGIAGGGGLPPLQQQNSTISVALDEVSGSCAMARVGTRTDNGPGIPASESTQNRVFANAMFNGLWIPPSAIPRLQPNSVLDEDQATGYRTIYTGVHGNVAGLVEQGPLKTIERFYDVQSGMLTAFRIIESQPNIGRSIAEYQIAR